MKVEPITNPKDIAKIKRLLRDDKRNRLLFIMGINTGLRVQDLLALRVNQVEQATIGVRIPLKEKKTGKDNVLIINEEIYKALQDYLCLINDKHASHKKLPDEYLFRSRKGRNYPLTTFAVTQMMQKWCDSIGLKINAGAHTMRKTWAYQQRKQFGTPWEVIAKRLNHSNPAVTRRYMGVQTEEVEEVLMNEI